MIDLSAAFSLGETVVDRLFPDKNKRVEELRKLEELKQNGDLAKLSAHVELLVGQLKINEQEAKSSNIFVAGWRPFVGWVCGLALLYSAILEPIFRFFTTVVFGYTREFPVIDTSLTMQVLLGMLGLSVMRTREKEKGVNR